MSTTSNTYSSGQNTQNPKQEPGYVDQAAGMLSSAAATVSSYLPTSVTNAMSGLGGPTDPYRAYRNKQLHVGGVGDLGTDSTQDVTRLPEERQHPDPYSESQPTTTFGAANPDAPTGVQNQYNNRTEGETFASGTSGVGAPTTQTSSTGLTAGYGTGISGVGGHPGEPGGVGDLGTMSTDDVARLPEERANPDPLGTTTGTGSQNVSFGVGGHPGFAGGVGDLGTKSTEEVAVLPEERVAPADTTTTSGDGLGGHGGRHHDITKDGSAGGHTGANYDVDHGLGMPHTRSMAPTSTTANATEDDANGSRQAPQSGQVQDESVMSPKEAGYPTGKPKLMDKVKGSVMVAAAKIGGGKDEEKIHQGQMLKETGKKVNPEEEARRAGQEEH